MLTISNFKSVILKFQSDIQNLKAGKDMYTYQQKSLNMAQMTDFTLTKMNTVTSKIRLSDEFIASANMLAAHANGIVEYLTNKTMSQDSKHADELVVDLDAQIPIKYNKDIYELVQTIVQLMKRARDKDILAYPLVELAGTQFLADIDQDGTVIKSRYDKKSGNITIVNSESISDDKTSEILSLFRSVHKLTGDMNDMQMIINHLVKSLPHLFSDKTDESTVTKD